MKVHTLNEDQQWNNQGTRRVVLLHGVAEGHVPGSQGLTKRGPLEKGMANHFSILTSSYILITNIIQETQCLRINEGRSMF